MNLRNLFKKSNSQDSIREYYELEEQLPTTEEAVDIIIDQFTEEQLDQLAIKSNGEVIDFKKLLLDMNENNSPMYSIDIIKKTVNSWINEHKGSFDLPSKSTAIRVFLPMINDLFKTYK